MLVSITRLAAVAIAVTVAVPAYAATTLPMDTTVTVSPVSDITSKKMKVGDDETFQVVNDVSQDGIVVIPRGALVKGTITWHTGKAIGGKSAKFDVTFTSITVGGHSYAMKGKHRQEGKGNTVAALLGSMIISGHSAVMEQGQEVPALTAEPITVE